MQPVVSLRSPGCTGSSAGSNEGCYLYAFSGPRDVKELELKVDTASLLELLNFMRYSFGGGTDVDRPLELSLDRLEQRDWSQVGSLHMCTAAMLWLGRPQE